MSTLGLDRSGNGNDWIAVNKTIDDQVLDVPTNNFATLNPLTDVGDITLTEGNLVCTNTADSWPSVFSTMGMTSGKWYFEAYGTDATRFAVGIAPKAFTVTNFDIESGAYVVYSTDPLTLYNNASSASAINGTPAFVAGNILGFAIDIDAGKMWIAINNTYVNDSGGDAGTPAAGNDPVMTFTAGTEMFVQTAINRANVRFNFGQDSSFAGGKTAQGNTDSNSIGDFYYEPPSGFLALCTENLPEPDVDSRNHFNTVIYTGNGGTNVITGVGFQPDFVWGKDRTGTDHHHLFDVVRGTNERLIPNLDAAENTELVCLNSFDTDGFTLGSNEGLNANTQLHVAWNWKAGNANTAFSESGNNPAGTHRANVAAGFSIVSYVGTGAAGTVAHGLSAAPEVMLIKNRDVTDAWAVYYGDNTDYMVLNTTAATADAATYWNDTSPTASVFTVNTAHSVNADAENYIAYVFHSVNGFSKMGTYLGNGADDGRFVYTGFKPAFIMAKEVGGANQWHMMDNKRSPINPVDDHLKAQDQAAEDVDNAEFVLDFVSNGFKWRDADHDNQATTYWYMAFAEGPFKYANAK